MRFRYARHRILVSALTIPATMSAQESTYKAYQACLELMRSSAGSEMARRTTNIQQSAKQDFCSSEFLKSSAAHAANGNAQVPIKGVPVKFVGGITDQNSLEKRTAFCSDNQQQFSLADSREYLHNFANPDAIQKARACEAVIIPRFIIGEVTGESIKTISLRLAPGVEAVGTVALRSVTHANLSPIGSGLEPGPLKASARSAQYTLTDTSREASLLAHTSAGDVFLEIPAAGARPVGTYQLSYRLPSELQSVGKVERSWTVPETAHETANIAAYPDSLNLRIIGPMETSCKMDDGADCMGNGGVGREPRISDDSLRFDVKVDKGWTNRPAFLRASANLYRLIPEVDLGTGPKTLYLKKQFQVRVPTKALSAVVQIEVREAGQSSRTFVFDPRQSAQLPSGVTLILTQATPTVIDFYFEYGPNQD